MTEKKPKSFRFSDETIRLLQKLAAALRSSETYALEQAVREMAANRGVK